MKKAINLQQQCGVLVKEEAEHNLFMISWTFLQSTLKVIPLK